jgi:hypothetical protein
MIQTAAIQSAFQHCCPATALLLAAAAFGAAQQPTDPPPLSSAPKPKKVYSNDDVRPAPSGTAAAQPAIANSQPGKDSHAELAGALRARLEKLSFRLKQTDGQIEDLQRFQAGESNGDASHQLHQGYNRTPIPEQIAKLEEKKRQLQAQVDLIYDQARKKGILPGQLR